MDNLHLSSTMLKTMKLMAMDVVKAAAVVQVLVLICILILIFHYCFAYLTPLLNLFLWPYFCVFNIFIMPFSSWQKLHLLLFRVKVTHLVYCKDYNC
jgi:hypothetical protein